MPLYTPGLLDGGAASEKLLEGVLVASASLAARLAVLVILLVLSYHDVRRREISYRQAAVLLAVAALGAAVTHAWTAVPKGLPIAAYIVSNLILLAGTAAMALLGLLGWGDVVVLAAVFLSAPTTLGGLLPSLLVVIAYYVAALVVYMIINLLYNLATAREQLAKLPSWRLRIAYALMARPRRARDLAENPGWWYPLTLCGKYKLTFNLYMDPSDIVHEVRKAIAKGCLKPDEVVWATYGIPAIPLLTAAYAAALIIGDKPLLTLLHSLAAARGATKWT